MSAQSGVPGEWKPLLVCFAMKEEARPFQRLADRITGCNVLLTGVGPRNAEKAIRRALSGGKPGGVFTCGFAGGLDPELARGIMVFEADKGTDLESILSEAGARPVKFHCSPRIAATVEEKRALRASTGADAVEMESEMIRKVCREYGVPSATIRIILDTASEDLALDFNLLMNSNQEMSYSRLALALVKSPNKIGALLALQKHTAAAGEALAQFLARALSV